jgi:hypothetical protein
MKWILSTEFTIEETDTGFVIYLLSGSWLEPLDLQTKKPDKMTIQDQAKYLRLGLAAVKKLMLTRLAFTNRPYPKYRLGG